MRAQEAGRSSVEALVARAKQRDYAAFEQLIRLYKDRIYNYVSRMLHDPTEAEDIAQETFIRAFQSLPHFRGVSSFQTWLYRIAGNLAIDAARRRKRRDSQSVSLDEPLNAQDGEVVRDVPDPRHGPAGMAEVNQLQGEVLKAIAELSPKLRPVIVLYDLQGLSYQDIAEVLGCPLGTVKSRLFNARAQLKEKLESRLPIEEMFRG
jgi:RNA polymerase sigma-70 factor (ECF subfamily)